MKLWPIAKRTPGLVFIVGGRRTGTTLLYGIVTASSSSIPMLAEGQLLTRLLEALDWALDNYEVNTKYFFASREEIQEFFKEEMELFVEHVRRQLGKRQTVVLKNPEYSFYLKHLERAFPSALYLITVRDPRDQVTSEYETGLRQIAKGMTNRAAQTRNIGDIAAHYKAYYSNFLPNDEEVPSRRLYVRYEDLVERSEPTIEKIRRFTGLEADGEKGSPPWSNRRVDFSVLQQLPSYSELYGKEISPSRVGRFKAVLTLEEIRSVERVCHDLMVAFDYPSI